MIPSIPIAYLTGRHYIDHHDRLVRVLYTSVTIDRTVISIDPFGNYKHVEYIKYRLILYNNSCIEMRLVYKLPTLIFNPEL